MRRIMLIALMLLLLPLAARAADPDWKNYSALSKMHDLGFEIIYLGDTSGYQGWLMRKQMADDQSDMRTVYTRAGQQVIISGLLYDKNGDSITAKQLQAAVDQGRIPDAAPAPATKPANAPAASGANLGAQLWQELGAAHTVNIGAVGDAAAPQFYIFVDPNCPYCKKLWQGLDATLGQGAKINLKLIVVGILGDSSYNLAQTILSAPDPAAAWRQNEAGIVPTGPATPQSQQLVDDNQNIMLRWGMTSVPFAVYRTAKGEVKILRGNPADVKIMLRDAGVAVK